MKEPGPIHPYVALGIPVLWRMCFRPPPLLMGAACFALDAHCVGMVRWFQADLTRPPRPQLDVRGWLQALTERWRIPSLLAPITPLSRLCCFPPRMPQNATNAPDATRMLQPPSIRRTVHDKCQTLRTVCARRPPTCCPSPSPTDRGPQANQKKYRPFSLPSHRTSKSPLLRLVLALTRSPP